MAVTDLLQQLIRIPSVNPDDTPGTDQTGEAELAAFLADWFEAIGAEVFVEEIQPGRPNLIARFAPLDGRPRILLGPHLDTVGVAGMTIEPFAAELREGRIWGRGASDTKGPMAAMMWGMKEHAEALRNSPVAVDFIGFMGEESGQWGSIQFGRDHGKAYEFAIVGEPTSLDVVNTTKGSLWATLRKTGVAAHSSQPERGENAVIGLARILDRLQREFALELARHEHPVLGASTMNVGIFRGGTRANIVPDLAEAEIDIRITPSLTNAGGARAALEAFLEEDSIEIIAAAEKPPLETPVDNPWIQRIQTVHPDSNTVGAPWFSDASHLSEAGIPSICLGPGSIDQAHTKDEFIAVEDLENGARLFADLIGSFIHPSASSPQ